MFNENAPDDAAATPNPTHDESAALVEAFKMGMMMASRGAQNAAAPAAPEPEQPKFPNVADGGAFVPEKRVRHAVPNLI